MEMSHTTIKRALKDALADLGDEGLLEFCDELRDRRTEPRITRRNVEGKSYLQITDLLVSTYTEQGALAVVLETLRKINCNQLAETLSELTAITDVQQRPGSKTKACVDKGDPVFRKTSKGELDSKPSQEALKYRASHQPLTAAGAPGTVKKPEEVEAEAKKQVLSECGDPCDERLVLSRSKIQFGQYKGQTFQWLLENDVGYTAHMIITQQKEREHTMCESPLMANKDSLTRYAVAYPEVLKEVEFKRAYEKPKKRPLQPRQKGQALVGFGKYKSETLKGLYESKDEEIMSYVNYLREKQSTCTPGSKMCDAIKYILQRDRRKTATKRLNATFGPGAAKKRQARGKWAQSTRAQYTSVSRPKQRKEKRSWKTNFSRLTHK